MNNSTPYDLPEPLTKLAGKEMQSYILQHENADEKALVLAHREIQGVSSSFVAAQISGRRKAKIKLPTWYNSPGMVFPSSLHVEQSSSELTAKYKAGLLNALLEMPKTCGADLTGGLGVDSYFLSKNFKVWDYVESDLALLQIARHNHSALGARNISYHHTQADTFLQTSEGRFDFVFIDPSRRKDSRKVYRFAECEPNIVTLLPKLLRKCSQVMIKASPMLDLLQGCNELRNVSRIFVLAVDNECREILFCCTPDSVSEPNITCENFSGSGARQDSFSFLFSEEKENTSGFSLPMAYLYEPNAAIMKAGAFKTLGRRFQVSKLEANTHLYTADAIHPNFPGRIFRIEDLSPGQGKFASRFPDGKVNVITRNYPLSPDQIKKKFRLHDGGEKYLIGFSSLQKKYLAAAGRIQ